MKKIGAIVLSALLLVITQKPLVIYKEPDVVEVKRIAETENEEMLYQLVYVTQEKVKQRKMELEKQEEEARKQQEIKEKRDTLGGEQEIENLYKIVMAESGNQGSYGQQLVTSVVINRMQSEKYPNTITGVITQKHQFSPVSNGTFYSAVPTQEVIDAVDTVIEEGVVTDALYFLNPDIASTGWTSGLTYVTTHRDHAFYK